MSDKNKPTEKDLIPGYQHIVLCDGYLGGNPAIFGKRISIRQILEGFANGMVFQDFADSFSLTPEVLAEVLRFAAEYAGDKNVVNRRKSA